MVSRTTKLTIVTLDEDGVGPTKLKSNDAMALGSGRTRIILVDVHGRPTTAGKFWETYTGRVLPAGGFQQQTPMREGNTETLRLRDGKRAVTRRWTSDGESKFTKLGDNFYKDQLRKYVVQVPVIIDGTRKNGTTYTAHSHLPVERLGLTSQTLPLNLSASEQDRKLKQMILLQLPDGALYEASKEQWGYDDEGSWIINEETVKYNEASGETKSHVVLDRRLEADPAILSRFLFSEALCQEAFENHEDSFCCPRQIAAVLKLDLGEVLQELRAVEQELYQTSELEQRGCTPRMLIEFAKKRELGCCALHKDKVIETIAGPPPVLAFIVDENHCYLYSCPRVRAALMKRDMVQGIKLKKAQGASTTPPMCEWILWGKEIAPSHDSCNDPELDAVRSWFMNRNRHQRVLLKDCVQARALSYTCTQRLDGCSGLLVTHGLPEHCGEIHLWVKKLDLGINYQGQGLAGSSLKVLKILLRAKQERVFLDGEAKARVMEQFDHRRALCGSRGGLQMDHIARVSDSHLQQAFQPLCMECHSNKTRLESRKHEDDELSSHFELGVWHDYVLLLERRLWSTGPKSLWMSWAAKSLTCGALGGTRCCTMWIESHCFALWMQSSSARSLNSAICASSRKNTQASSRNWVTRALAGSTGLKPSGSSILASSTGLEFHTS